MSVAARPLSANRGRPSPGYTSTLQRAARAQGVDILLGPLYARITWFQRWHSQGDIDNIAKRILDSLIGVVIPDDAEVVKCLTQKTVADPIGRYAYDPRTIPSATNRSELGALLGAYDHVLYIEVGAMTDPTISFGPVI